MGKAKKVTGVRFEPTIRCPDRIVIQSHGMGVESQAILERWVAEPESRPFVSWDQLIVISAQVGEEHVVDTIAHCEQRMLPLLREHNVRFVELARRGHLEEEGIVVLQDTRQPRRLHPDGVYKLSDELLHSGTVPQFGGEHRCAMKFKAFVIETWLAWEFRGSEDKPVYHVFGYNENEKSRITNSDFHIARHNEERLVDAKGRPPLEIFGFNNEEIGRAERSKAYDGPNRIGCYPLLEWEWGRRKCVDYIRERSGIDWKKSHCSFCLSGDTTVIARGGPCSLRDLKKNKREILVPRIVRSQQCAGVKVMGGTGEWQAAPVRSFGVQRLYHLRWEGSPGVYKDVYATAEHEWVSDTSKGRVIKVKTKDLLPGFRTYGVTAPRQGGSYEATKCFELCFVEPTNRKEEVYCATVAGVGAFVLEGGLVTGNCPFCAEASKALDYAIERWHAAPGQTAHGLLVEHNSLCFNPRGQLYRNNALIDVIRENNVVPVLEAFEHELGQIPWGLYRVRRIYSKKGKAIRCVEPVMSSRDPEARQLMEREFHALDLRSDIRFENDSWRGIDYKFFQRREPDSYPATEGFYVVAPGFMELKLRGPLWKFNIRWERAVRGLDPNPPKWPKDEAEARRRWREIVPDMTGEPRGCPACDI